MKRSILTIASLALMAMPAMALTLEQAQNELAGMSCSGSSCTSEQTITTTNDVLIQAAESGDPAPIANTDDAYVPGWWNEKCKTIAYVNEDCTVQSLNPGNLGSRPAVYGTEDVYSCETTTKTLSYNGPFTSRDKAWSVDTNVSSNDGAC